MAIVLPVRLDETRRAVLGAELASLNTAHRTLEMQKKAAAKDYSNKIEKVETRSIPLEEALKAAKASAKVLVLPLEVDCEARQTPGKPDHYDIFRMDTDPPTWVKQIHQPRQGEQPGLPGIDDTPAQAPGAEEGWLVKGIQDQLKDVDFPADDEPPAAASPPAPGADDDDESPLG